METRRNNHGKLGGNIFLSVQMSSEKCEYQPIEIIRVLHRNMQNYVPIPSSKKSFGRYPFYDGNSCGKKKSKLIFGKKSSAPPKTNMTMEKQPFEDVSPIQNGDLLLSC